MSLSPVSPPSLPEVRSTNEAAASLGRKPQTLRRWASLGGPISPIRINGRLLWRVADLSRLLNGEEVAHHG